MDIARDFPQLRASLARLVPPGRRLGLVPTMGALHAGHIALVDAALAAADVVAASIFVNPLQFAASEDLARYPRTEEQDLAALEAAGCALVWMPTLEVMYAPGRATSIDIGGPAQGWEGDHRPGHFRGVATVCTKLFLQTAADVALFGEKDWQQLQVVRRVVRDLDIPTRISAHRTVREADGLAMSSPNRFLTAEERALAPVLYATMRGVAEAIETLTPVADAAAAGERALREAGFGVDYLAVVGAETMLPVTAPPGRLIAAARLGSVRLLDNIPVGPE